MAMLARRQRRPERTLAQEIRDRYLAFLPYVLPKITVIQPSLVPDGYNAGLVAAHSETLRDAINISSDGGRIKLAWLALTQRDREALSQDLFGHCVDRARNQGYPTDDWHMLARTESVRRAPVGGTDPLAVSEPMDAAH